MIVCPELTLDEELEILVAERRLGVRIVDGFRLFADRALAEGCYSDRLLELADFGDDTFAFNRALDRLLGEVGYTLSLEACLYWFAVKFQMRSKTEPVGALQDLWQSWCRTPFDYPASGQGDAGLSSLLEAGYKIAEPPGLTDDAQKEIIAKGAWFLWERDFGKRPTQFGTIHLQALRAR